MTVIWRFRISNGMWVCATCGAEMEESPDENGVIMKHQDGCAQVTTTH